MKVKILRQVTPVSEPYWEGFNYDGPPDISVAGLLDHLNYNDDIVNTDGNKTGRVRPLISEAAATSDLYVTYGSVSYDGQNGIVKFSDLKVCRSSNDAVIAGMGDESNGSLAIRVFSVVPE